MKIIYIGGYTNHENSHFINYRGFIQNYINKGKKVVIVALSKDPGYFTERLNKLYTGNFRVLESNSKKGIVWNTFDLIYILGGTTQRLKNGLLEFGFSLDNVNKESVIICDSAGGNIMAKYYIGYDENKNYIVEEGLNPKSNIFILNHVDNKDKTPHKKIEFAQLKSKELEANLLLLKENEQSLVINNEESSKKELAEIINFIESK